MSTAAELPYMAVAAAVLPHMATAVTECHGVDIPSAGVPYLNVMRWGSGKILDMIV